MSSTKYTLRLCSALPDSDRGQCTAGAAVCRDKKDVLGMSAFPQYRTFAENSVTVTYSGGLACRLDGENVWIVG